MDLLACAFSILSSPTPHRVAAAAHWGAREEISGWAESPTPPSSSVFLPTWGPPLPLLRLRQQRLLRLRHLRLRRRHLLRLGLRQHLYLAMVLDGFGLDAQSRGTTLTEPANL